MYSSFTVYVHFLCCYSYCSFWRTHWKKVNPLTKKMENVGSPITRFAPLE